MCLTSATSQDKPNISPSIRLDPSLRLSCRAKIKCALVSMASHSAALLSASPLASPPGCRSLGSLQRPTAGVQETCSKQSPPASFQRQRFLPVAWDMDPDTFEMAQSVATNLTTAYLGAPAVRRHQLRLPEGPPRPYIPDNEWSSFLS